MIRDRQDVATYTAAWRQGKHQGRCTNLRTLRTSFEYSYPDKHLCITDEKSNAKFANSLPNIQLKKIHRLTAEPAALWNGP